MMERSEIKMIRAGKDDKSILRRIDPDTCRALCDSLEEALDELDRLRAAPPPSPDIAGLVDRAENAVLGAYSDRGTRLIAEELLTALQRVAQEREAAAQLNNKYAWESEKAREERDAAERRSEAFWEPQITAAEARIATARDEGIEAVAVLIEQRTLPIPERQELAAAIRELKGQPK